ncbi:methionine--tRNA ligase [Novosphingobium umbonatum]|uniref:Methionine--tRNA ligase n=1 Tax=Novosphingobium umbonatum TaxID=1908524 RepID=A0A3S2UT15_9SPHN|nr:methionine--tRNA ligase [Novosphingobium umbonatum]RVU06256.1 methionine--tRNA ligase [Novosphingobium umbonatum]
MAEPFYITTAIAYPNGKPHIGHAYEAIAADVIARFQRAQGRDVRFQTGTDEHGLKMAQKARELGMTVRDLCDEMSAHFQAMCDALNISYDRFQRTTAPEHYTASQAIWRAMADKGDLYLDRYEGWYSVRDEAFYDESELVEGEGGVKLSPQGTPVEWNVEESWFFRLSAYGDKLLAYFEANPDFIQPESRRNEVISFVKGGLRDLSVSRTSFDWGVPVPDAPGHVMYVWVDALTNYITGLGYPEKTPEMEKWWPANIHLIGKDIVRFHTVYWPAFLMSADLPLPKTVFGHGFLLHRGEKMSKSLGNVVDPLELAETFGVDALRYFLMREVSFGNDGSYSAKAIVTRCNAELANSFGNLAQRTLSLIFKNLGGELPEFNGNSFQEEINLAEIQYKELAEGLIPLFEKMDFSQGIDCWMRAVYACNQYIDAQAPWKLKKENPERMKDVLAMLFLQLRDLAIAIAPVIPDSANRLLDQMGIPADERNLGSIYENTLDPYTWYERLRQSGFTLSQPVGVFPRLEMPVDAD